MATYSLARNGNIINKKYIEYFWPTVLVALANNIAIMVDSIIVGNMLGSVSMAAISLLSPVTQFYFSMTILFGLGASTLISFAKGEGNKKAADRTFTVAFVILVCLCVLLMLSQFLFIRQIASALTPIPELNRELKKYYVPFIIGTPFFLLLSSVVHCIRSDARPKFASNLIIISNAVNLIMDLVLMGPCHMGIAGSATATVIGNVIAFAIMLTHFKDKRNTLHFDFSVLKDIRAFSKECISLLTTGISGALGTLLITVTTFYMNSMIQNAAGSEGMVAMSVISNCQVFISAFVTGASQTMIPIVSTLLGEKDNVGIKYALRKAVQVLLTAGLTITLIIELAPGFVARLFGEKTPQEMEVIIPALRISALSFLGMAISFLIMYYFTATKKKVISLTISIVNGIAITIPCAYILSRLFGITGLWLTMVIAQYGTWLVIAIMVIVTKQKSQGMYQDFYLLQSNTAKEMLSFSVNSDYSGEQVEAYMTEQLSDATGKYQNIMKATLETLSFINEEDKGNFVETDVRINLEGKEYVILMRSNGGELDSEKFQASCKSFHCNRVLGMNQIRETI